MSKLIANLLSKFICVEFVKYFPYFPPRMKKLNELFPFGALTYEVWFIAYKTNNILSHFSKCKERNA